MSQDFEVDFEVKNEAGKKLSVFYKGEFEWVLKCDDLDRCDYEVEIDESSMFVMEGDDEVWRKLKVSEEGYYSELADVIDDNYREALENQSPF